MARIIGSGLEALKDFIRKCKAAGGNPTVRTQFSGVPFKDKVIVACYGKAKKVPGGTITGLSPLLVERIRKAVSGAGALTDEQLRELGLI